MLIVFAIPYGIGAGSVDASLNNYVALHYASRHMSWLHCMWGIGASVGPYIMGAALSSRAGWQTGYRVISVMQMVLTIIILLSLPLWKTKSGANAEEREAVPAEALTLKQIFRISGVKEVLVTFFCYCSLEQTTSLWASSYLVLNRGIAPETAAPLAMADYRTQQLDLLADGVRSALDMDAVYAAMGLHNPRGGKK